MTDNDTNRAAIARMFDLMNDRHLDELGRLCTDDGLMCGLRQALIAFPDLRHRIDALILDGDRAATPFTATGTHVGRFGELPPTQRAVTITGVIVMRLRDGLIEQADTFVDTQGLMRQLTAPPATVD